jgi:Zn-dependent peptidase ImmA (M78 family)
VINGIVGNNTHRKLDVEEFRGFVLVDDYAPLVFVNGADAKAAQMFTLAHELAHVIFGSSAAFDLRQLTAATAPIEQACNRAAAEFLVPIELLRQRWRGVGNQANPFDSLAHQFKVSQLVAARRALDAQLITRDRFFAFYAEYLAHERKKTDDSEGGNFYATQHQRVGSRMASAIVRAVREGKLLYADAYRLTGLRGKTFETFAASVAERGG